MLNFDISGNDTRYLFGDGQGFGGVGGVGICADYRGDDKYTAEPFEDVAPTATPGRAGSAR
jgi:hypothetical protein